MHILRNLIAASVFATAIAAHAQGYPAKPITFLNPFPAGGGTDTFARPIAARMSATTSR